MDSYIYYANTQVNISILSTLAFIILASIMSNFGDKMANYWNYTSIIIGIFSFTVFYIQLIFTNSIGSSEITLGISIIWYMALILVYCQFTSFITGFIIYIYNSHHTISNILINDEEPKKNMKYSIFLWGFVSILFLIMIFGIMSIIYYI